ncbi:bile acid:sodium symporter family protein [Paenibacillus sp. CN-4]|uniref:bile acid:sodium symporter family protein n=1 Tax=Paenibacillus nanchangensis TaxID=3348343 RepID=UPI00397BA5CE
MLSGINRLLDKMMPFITPGSLILGMVFAEWLMPYRFLSIGLFAFMTWVGALGAGTRDFVRVMKQPVPVVLVIVVMHVIMPLVALAAGTLLFGGDRDTITGLVLGMSIPTGVTSLFWATTSGGNAAFALSVILLDTLLAPFIVPGTVVAVIGTGVHMDTTDMMTSLLYMIVLPSLAGILANKWSRGASERVWKPWLNPWAKVAMGTVVALNGAYVAPYFADFDLKLAGILGTVIVFTITAYALAWWSGKWIGCSDDIAIAMTYTIGMRNISAGAVLAVTFFPAATAVPVIVGMLIQQVMASQVNQLLKRRKRMMPELSPDKKAAV